MEEAVEERGEEEPTQNLGRITVAKLWCHEMGMYALWKDDAITGGSDLSTSHDEDTARVESGSFGTWFYGTTLIFLWEIIADSYESAIRGFWDGKITLNFAVI